MTKLTVVVPTHNLGRYVDVTLQALAKQTVAFELWLVDDHSTDGTAEKIADFAAQSDHYHARLFEKHRGVSAARNYGIKQATGDAVAFVDGDDMIHDDYVETLANGFEQDVAAVAVGYEWWRPSGRQPDEYQELTQRAMFNQAISRGSQVGGYVWNKAFRLNLLQAMNLTFDESLTLAEDYLFTATFIAKNPGIYKFNPAVRYQKINRPNSTIHTRSFADRSAEERVFADMRRLEKYLK